MASTYNHNHHDIAITNPGTDGSGTDLIGMMLAKKKGVPVWTVLDGKALADQFFTGAPAQDYTDPEEEILLAQSDWRAGFGLEVADPSDSKRYYSSIGADLRFRGMAIAGPVPTTITIPVATAPALTDGGLEIWTDVNNLTNWTKEQVTLTQEGTTKHGGTYSAKLRYTAPSGSIYQDIAWVSTYQGRRITLTFWAWTAAASNARIAINDGVGTTYSSYHAGDSQWAQLTVTRVLSTAATRLRILAYVDANADAYFDDAAISGTTPAKIVAFAEFNDALYMAQGAVLAKLNAGGTAFTSVYEFANAITDIEPFTDSNLYIAFGTSNNYFYMNTSEAFTESNAVVKTFQFFKTVHTATPVLWANDGVNTIRSNTNPINGGAAWSGQTTVGSSYYNITALIQKSGALYIMKEDMPYYLNSAGAVQNDLAPELTTCTSSTSGKNVKLWKSNLYIPAGSAALLRTDGTTNEFINPSSSAPNASAFAGQVMALAFDEEYLFAAVDNSTKVEILTGRDETVDSVAAFRWHPIAEITLAGAEVMFVSSVVSKRLYVASTDNSQALYYIGLPSGYGNVINDANRSFKTGSYFETSYLHGNFKSNLKAFIKLTVTLGHAYDADIYWTADYEKLGDSSYINIGNFDGTTANRMESLFIPLDGSNKPISTMMRFKFTAVTDDSTKTPIMLQYTASAVMYPTIKTVYVAQIVCAEEITCKNGMTDKNMYDTIIATLDNARNATWPVSIRDLDGNTHTVKLLPLPKNMPRYEIVADEKGREKERLYTVMMQEIPLS